MAARAVAVVASDLHLQDATFAGLPLRGDAYHSFRQVVAGVGAADVGHLVLAGDIVNQPSNPEGPIAVLVEGLRALHDRGAEVNFILGQHDGGCRWPALAPNAFHADGRKLWLDGVEGYALDYRPAGRLAEALAGVPRSAQVLFAHQVWADFMGDVACPQGAFRDVPHVALMVTGDYHKCETAAATGASGQALTVFSPGSSYLRATNEPFDKYYGVLYDDLSVRPVRLRTRPVVEWAALGTEASLEDLLASVPARLDRLYDENADLPDEVRAPLVRFDYSHRFPDALRRLRRAAAGRAHVAGYEVPAPEEAGAVSRVTAPGVELSLEGCLGLVVNRDEDPELYALAALTLTAADPGAELARWAEAAVAASAARAEEIQ